MEEVAAGRETVDAANKATMDAASEQARERTDAARAMAEQAADQGDKVLEEMRILRRQQRITTPR